MATMTRNHNYVRTPGKAGVQKVCIALGVVFLVVGFAGILMRDLMGMHLSMAHNIIHLGSGALALWAGYASDPRKAYTFSLIFGIVYGLLGLAGFVIGQPGYPGVGHLKGDQNLLRIIPNILELGTNDHIVHVFFSVVLLFGAFSWTRKNVNSNRSIGDTSKLDTVGRGDFFRGTTTRPNERNSSTDLPDAPLGRSDINRPSDIKRRDDFERRV